MKHEYEKLKVEMEEKEKEVIVISVMVNNSSKPCGVNQLLRQLVNHPRWKPFVFSWMRKKRRFLKSDRS